MAVTKGEPLSERLQHALGERRIEHCFRNMLTAYSRNLIDHLTDDARNELIRRCIASHKLTRKYNAESRRLHRERAAS